MRAWSLIRDQPHYRSDAFIAGLKAVGYEMGSGHPSGKPGNLLCIWNRYGSCETIADRFEADGGAVYVAENGYIQGRHDGGDYYAIAKHGHNGSGQWPEGGPERWEKLGVEIKPWREGGNHILIAPNRSFGMRGMVMPMDWPDKAVKRLQDAAERPLRVRLHPGNNAPKTPLSHDLEGAHSVVIWSSSVGVKALIEGIPVVCDAPYWIMKSATGMDKPDRLPAFQRLAWAQWNTEEIAAGTPFRYLL